MDRKTQTTELTQKEIYNVNKSVAKLRYVIHN